MKVAVIGLGYVGTVTAACLAANGHDVWGVDVDAAKVQEIVLGRSPVAEPGLNEMIQRVVGEGRLHATTSSEQAIGQADISLVCVGTPSTSRGGTDLSYVLRAVEDIAAALRGAAPAAANGSHVVVIRSTVPPGTVEEQVAPALARGLQGVSLHAGTAMCPEFLREGSGISDFYAPSLVIAGTTDSASAAAITELFGFLRQPVQIVPPRVAESLKYACNAFHATKVSFANEVARLLRLFDVDSRQVMELFCQDDVLNISPRYLRPGFAFGGSCLPKDLRSLLHMARLNGADLPLLAATLTTNELSIREVIDRVIAYDARTVGLFGLSFKASTDDLRESPNVELAERLIGKGFEVRIYDQVVNPSRLVGSNLRYISARLPHLERLLAARPEEALADADVAIVSAAEPAVVDALLGSPPPHVIDLSGQLGAGVEALAGYEGIGW